jgi:hypothetical protein
MNRLKTILQTNFSNEIHLGTINHSCCPADTTPVFDFDTIKDSFCKLLRIEPMKSVDALYFSPTGKLLLIEMKRYVAGQPMSIKDYIESHFSESELPHKVVDTIILLLSICGYYGINQLFYEYFLNVNPTPKMKTIFLINLSDREYIRYVYLNTTDRSISFTKRIDNRIAILNCKHFTTFLPSY